MEVSRFVLGQSSCFSIAGMDIHAPRSNYSDSSSSLSNPCHGISGFSLRPGKMCGFSDTGHLEYYNYNNKSSGIIRCGKKENIKEKEAKKVKNKLKLLKGLSKDLSTFTNMGFGFNSDEVKGSTITVFITNNHEVYNFVCLLFFFVLKWVSIVCWNQLMIGCCLFAFRGIILY